MKTLQRLRKCKKGNKKNRIRNWNTKKSLKTGIKNWNITAFAGIEHTSFKTIISRKMLLFPSRQQRLNFKWRFSGLLYAARQREATLGCKEKGATVTEFDWSGSTPDGAIFKISLGPHVQYCTMFSLQKSTNFKKFWTSYAALHAGSFRPCKGASVYSKTIPYTPLLTINPLLSILWPVAAKVLKISLTQEVQISVKKILFDEIVQTWEIKF